MERKVIVRRKEVLNHLPKEIRARAKVKLGSIFVDRHPLKGVDGEEGDLKGSILSTFYILSDPVYKESGMTIKIYVDINYA
jgi:hypothetical protein